MKNITFKSFDGYKYVEGGVCAAKGFKANGVYAGIKKNDKKKNDLTVIVSDAECCAAAVYTQNKVKGAPVTVTKKRTSPLRAARLRPSSRTLRTQTPATLTARRKHSECASWRRRA